MQQRLHLRSSGYATRKQCARIARPCRGRLIRRCSSAENPASIDTKPKPVPIPQNPAQQTAQAAAAIEAAWRAGIKRQRLELSLPLIGATDLDDWPGGIRQQFKAASPLVESILRSLKQLSGLQGPLSAEIWDQGDAVGAWTGDKLAAVLFPTADSVDRLRQLANGPNAPDLLLVVNPQWESKGNLYSDFGFGQRKQKGEEFVAGFTPTYYLKSLRVYGDEVRLLKSHPAPWQVHLINKRGASEIISTQETMPSYKEVEALLKSRPSSSMNKTWLQRLQDEYKFNQNSLKL